ncbi:hypothetical protein D3C72_2146290 [compost metagenome]
MMPSSSARPIPLSASRRWINGRVSSEWPFTTGMVAEKKRSSTATAIETCVFDVSIARYFMIELTERNRGVIID